MNKTLIIYYSRRGQNYVRGNIVELEKGNTEIIVEAVKSAVDADTFEIKTDKEYSSDYMTCTEEAKDELRNNARPELKEYLEDISQYEKVIVAGPCWWGTYPMAVFTQLEKLDFSGKTIFPVVTHEGSGLSNAAKDLKKICKGATIGKELVIQGAVVGASEDKIKEWAERYIK